MIKQKKILLIEDDKDFVMLLRDRFEMSGYEVDAICNGDEAMRTVANFMPDLIVLDILLPKQDGYKICASIKSNPIYKHIPIIMFTALELKIQKQTALDLGANVYISKSSGVEAVLQSVKTLLPQ
ncbi:MAG: response regulator [Chlamydiota bacterium]|nr:response regulator [Chlamydiota bacterium]